MSDDEVFVIENGIVTNQNVPLILAHDLEDPAGIELGDQFPEFVADADQIIEDDFGENNPGFPDIEMPENGHVSTSSSSSTAQSSSVSFEKGEMLSASSPTPNVAAAGYVNMCFQSDDTSSLSEFNPSVEVRPRTSTASYRASQRVVDEKKPAERSSSSENKETQIASTSTGLAAFDRTVGASTSTDDNSELISPNPPNSPAGFGSRLNRSSKLLRRYRNRGNPHVQRVNNSNSPANFFRKLGSFFLILVFILFLVTVACLEGLFPRNCLTVVLILWGLSFVAAVACYAKACWVVRDLEPESPDSSSGYGSTGITRPGLGNNA